MVRRKLQLLSGQRLFGGVPVCVETKQCYGAMWNLWAAVLSTESRLLVTEGSRRDEVVVL